MPALRYVSALVFCFVGSVPSYALTNVSACGTYSANDKYVVQADLSSSSTTVACLHFTGIASAVNGIEIDLNGHNVVSTAYHALDIDTSVGSIYIHDSVGTGSFKGKVGYSGSGPTVTPAIYILNSATNPAARILISGVRAYGEIRVQSTDKTAFPMKNFHSEYNHIYNGLWTLIKVDNPYMTGEYVDNRNDTTILIVGGVDTQDCDSPFIEYSTIIGGPGVNSVSTVLNTDDGVIIQCATGTCNGGTIDHIAVYDVFDSGWEGTGHLTNTHVTNNNIYRATVAGVGMFGPYLASLSNSEIKNNSVIGTTRLFYIYGGTDGSSFFNNNMISGNSVNASNSSIIGGVGTNFVTFTNNTLTNNSFGNAAQLQLQSSAGVIDGGGNHCSSVTPNGAIGC